MSKTKRLEVNHLMLERLVYIHQELSALSYPNCTQLAKKLECSVSTINRDIEFLRDRFYAPIIYDYTKRGYCYSRDYTLPFTALLPKDASILSQVKILLAHYKGTPLYNEVRDVLDMLLPQNVAYDTECMQRITVPPVPPIRIDEKVWNKVYTAMRNSAIIEFDYNGRHRTETTHRRVHPYQILIDEGLCFVFGFCELRNAERLFCLSRMRNLIVTKNKFRLPKDFDFSSRCGGGKFGSFIETTVQKYTIQFYGPARQYVKDYLWAEDQKIIDYDDEGITEITFSSAQTYRVLEWVLSQGSNARPISPAFFVAEWKSEIKRMADSTGEN